MLLAPTPWTPNEEPESFLIKDAAGTLVASSRYRDQIIAGVNGTTQAEDEIKRLKALLGQVNVTLVAHGKMDANTPLHERIVASISET